MEAILGSVTMFGGNFAPRGWALCQGQLLSISQNTALFSLLGTYYGGDGRTTFGLPDLRGRAVVGVGQGPGLSNYDIGESGGTEGTTLIGQQLAIHVHPMAARLTSKASTTSDAPSPVGNVYATPSGGDPLYSTSPSVNMLSYVGTVTTQPAGNSFPFSNLHPLLVINYILCMQGVFPQRP